MRAILPLLFSKCGFVALADDAVFPAFRFDARYASSGVTPALWAANEACAFSSLFALRTRPLLTDTDGHDGASGVHCLHGSHEFGLILCDFDRCQKGGSAARSRQQPDSSQGGIDGNGEWLCHFVADGWNTEPIAVVEGTGKEVSVPVDQTGPARFFRVTVDMCPASDP